MTPQEALYWHTHNGATIQQEAEVELIIINALNKQIPTKPTISVHRYLYNGEETSVNFTHCPCCFGSIHLGYFDTLVDKDSAHCRRCGQALDWSDTYDGQT